MIMIMKMKMMVMMIIMMMIMMVDDVLGYLLSIIVLCLGVHSYSEPECGCL